VPILLVGSPNTGKTAFLNFLLRIDAGSAVQSFSEEYVPTEKSHFVIHVANATTSLQFWEVTGKVGVGRSLLLKAKAVVFFVDLSNGETLQDLDVIYSRFKAAALIEHDSFPCVLVGSKLDLCFGGSTIDGAQPLSEADLQRWATKKRPLAQADALFVPSSSSSLTPPSSPATSPAAPTDARIKVAMISSRTGAGIRPLISHLCSLADVPDSLSSASPVRGGDGGSVYGGSQLSHTSWDSSHSPAGGHSSSLSAFSPASSASSSTGSALFPFSDLARQRYFPASGLNSPMQQHHNQQQQRLSLSASGNKGGGDSFSEVGSEVSSAVTSLTEDGFGQQSSRDSFKIVFVGAPKVGKTTLLRLFCDKGRMSSDAAEADRYEPTIGADCREVGCLGAKLQVWDSSGQRKMLALGRSLFKGADGLVLVFDVSDSSSFADLDLYLDNFLAHRGKAGAGGKRGAHSAKDLPLVLVGHKAELGAGTKASRTAQAEVWLRQRNLRCGRYIESSRANPRSVELVFEAMADFFAPGSGPGEAGADSVSSVGSMGSRASSRAGALPPLQPSSTTLPPLPPFSAASSIFSWGAAPSSAPDTVKGSATSPATGPGAGRGQRLSPLPSPGAPRTHVHATGSGPRVSRIQDGRPGLGVGPGPGQMEERTCMPCSLFSSLW